MHSAATRTVLSQVLQCTREIGPNLLPAVKLLQAVKIVPAVNIDASSKIATSIKIAASIKMLAVKSLPALKVVFFMFLLYISPPNRKRVGKHSLGPVVISFLPISS